MQYFNFNGNIFDKSRPVIAATSPGLRYGDGLFETMKLLDGKLINATEHFERLWKGLNLLRFSIPDNFDASLLEKIISEITSKNVLTSARIRLAVYRNEEAGFDYVIEADPLVQKDFNTTGLRLGLFSSGRKACDGYSNLKHNNFLVYRLGNIYAEENGLDDVIILNDKGRVCDSTKANVFLIKENKISTPSLKEGCVAGVMRKKILHQLKNLNYEVKEISLTIKDLETADEIFLTNSIFDMHWVGNFMEDSKANKICTKIYDQIFGNKTK